MNQSPRQPFTVVEEFLKHEWEQSYKNAFKDFAAFQLAMQQYVMQCVRCHACYWLSGDKWCYCDHSNTNQHDKIPAD